MLGQEFHLGADMSYVNEMEDCKVDFFEDGHKKDPYAILQDHGGNIVRLRLWHAPKWYEDLNDGNLYSDFNDLKKAIRRVKEKGMHTLLDFHLSDDWADPKKQLVPRAWLPIVDDTEILKDSLYQYIYQSLTALHKHQLLPEMVQIGNETNKGILLNPEENKKWTLDWERNAALFNAGIKAVRDFEKEHHQNIKIVLHVAAPDNASWLLDGFKNSGITDFDIIGLSYYWAWHKPTTIKETGVVIMELRTHFPDKEVMIVETGYIWTNESNDQASNIISEEHPDFTPASPEHQRDWLIKMTQEVIRAGAIGVIYWEPFWVSSPCFTRWGKGSHQEHATFFDFNNELLLPGGIEWMQFPYDTSQFDIAPIPFQIMSNSFSGDITIRNYNDPVRTYQMDILDATGMKIWSENFLVKEKKFSLKDYGVGVYTIQIYQNGKLQLEKLYNFSNI